MRCLFREILSFRRGPIRLVGGEGGSSGGLKGESLGRSPSLTETLDKTVERLYKDYMKTLRITDAKKNLGRWLAAASRGEDIGIVYGADIIALRKVEVESTDYAQRQYGATSEQVARLEEATDKRYARLKRTGKLATVTAEELRKLIG